MRTLSKPSARGDRYQVLSQAWQEYCKDRQRCRGLPPVPNKSYVISLPEDSTKRDVLIPRLKELGLEVEVVDGILSDQVKHWAEDDISMTSDLPSVKRLFC